MAEDENKNIIVSRIQHRRGLKQDLPQPLRPGEIGLATDSRQLYVGGDPDDPQSAPYNSVSYFENTVGARDYTVSVANNQILAFQVPFTLYTRGEFNGTTVQKGWQPNDVRSIVSSSAQPDCAYTSSDYQIFTSDTRTLSSIHSLTGSLPIGGTVIEMSSTGGSDESGNVRVGDNVMFPGSNVQTMVVGISTNPISGSFTVKLSEGSPVTAIQGDQIEFIHQHAVNYSKLDLPSTDTTRNGAETQLKRAAFISEDVVVRKNGIKLIPEANASMLEMPGGAYDYTIDGSNTASNGTHYLTLRTRPESTDSVSVCYYSNANVILAFEGIEATGKIAPNCPVDSFYTQYNIHPYRQIPRENIRVSDTTGIGFIGLQQKHIVSVADGSPIPDTYDVTLGEFLLARLDDTITTSIFEKNAALSTLDHLYYTITISAGSDVFSPIINNDVYKYNRALIRTPQPNLFLNNKVAGIISVASNGQESELTIEVDTHDYEITRSTSANLSPQGGGNGFTNNVSATMTLIDFACSETDGMQADDYVRIVDAAGNPAACDLHGGIFKVLRTTATGFTVNVSTDISAGAPHPFTANIASLYYVNHGSDAGNVNNCYQIRSVNHGLKGTEVTEIESVEDISGGDGLVIGNSYDIDTGVFTHTANTFFVVNNPVNTDDKIALGLGGRYRPVLATPYNNYKVVPVLSIDCSSNTTVKQAMTTINKELVDIPKVNPSGPVQLFPHLDWLPQESGALDTLYLTQKPSYTSVQVGGLEFAIFDDEVGTVSALGLTPGVFDTKTNSVKAKLETWMNNLVNNRDVNLFTNVFTGGDLYSTPLPNHFKQYDLNIDDTFGEITFCDRFEAENFNFIVNSAYSESPFDRAEDDQNGTRGLVNLKNNLEIQTREGASVGEKILTYTSLESTIILQSDTYDEELFGIDATKYNTFVLDYSMTESPVGGVTKYMRSGTITVTARPDFTDAANAVVFSDNFNSHWETPLVHAIVEPQLQAELVNGRVVFSMIRQFSDPANPVLGDYVAHTLETNLKLKYVFKRWSSID